MTTEPTSTVVLGIVACATCDTVFRAHEGRQTCPQCGGDPGYLIIDYSQVDSETPPADSPAPPEATAEPADASEAPPADVGVAPAEPPVPAGDKAGGNRQEEPAPAKAGSSRRRSHP